MIQFTKNNIEKLKQIVCYNKEVDPDMLLLKTRKREIVESRQLVAYFLYKKFEKRSLHKRGLELGKDHATIIHSIQTVERLKEVDKDYYFVFDNILKQVLLLNITNTVKRKKLLRLKIWSLLYSPTVTMIIQKLQKKLSEEVEQR